MKRLLAAGLLVLLAAPCLRAQGQEKVIDVRGTRPSGNSFDALWALYRKAETAADTETSRKLFEEMRRLRIERNIRSLEPVGLAFVARGLESLGKGERDKAEESFRRAMALDPQLPDAYFGLALSEVKKGLLGFLPALKDVAGAFTSRISTVRGSYDLLAMLVAVGLLTALVTAAVLALVLAIRYGTLLLHDLEESFGPGRKSLAVAVYAILLFLPLVTFQGYAWLPLWWLALLFIYASRTEQVLTLVILVGSVLVGPATELLRVRVQAMQNPLFRAGLLAVEDGPDARAIADLEAAMRKFPDDRDVAYLLAIQYKKAGLYEEAANLYRDILRQDERDAIALNNLANLEFAGGEFPAAITRYKLAAQAAEGGMTSDVVGTIHYNLSLAYLQKFDRQPADEARSQADRLAGGLTRVYDTLWKYEAKNENAVVDLGLNQDQLWGKFNGAREGIGAKGLAGRAAPGLDVTDLAKAGANRFAGFLGVFAFVYFALGRWRGSRTFTVRCQKCGTPFCKRCHLGAAPSGLCTQCFHLFVVRDGVSGPARNQKLMEVQKEDERRERIFRALSLLSPGAGHVYAHKTVAGVVFVLIWYGLLALCLLAGRVLPVTEAPAALAGRWTLVAAAMALLATYVAANRARPDFEVALPVQPRGARRGGRAA